MAKDVNWGVVFGGIAAVAGIIALYRVNGSSAGPTNNVFPALNEGAMAGPSVPGYNVPTLAQVTQPNNSLPNPYTQNQMTSRKKKLHDKWQNWRDQNKKKCCNPCDQNSNSAVVNATPTDLMASYYNELYS